MYKDNCICMVCGNISEFYVRNNRNEREESNYSIIEKNSDGTFKCEVIVKCSNCRLSQKIFRNINFIVEN